MGQSEAQFDANDVEILEEETLFQGFFSVRGLTLRHRCFDGGWTESFTREVFMRNDATCVLPYDPVLDQVVLLEQFRAGALGRDSSPWLLEIVAGIDEREATPEQTARREAQEEAGLALGRLEHICDYLASPGGSNELVHLYCASVDSRGAGGVHGLDHENEDIRVCPMTYAQAQEALASGRIWNAPAIMALQWLALNRERLRAAWGRP